MACTGEAGNVNKDTILGITYQERRLVNDTWNLVRNDLSANGILMFTIFFEDHPQHMKYFPFKQTLTKETMDKDPMVKLHGLRVMKEMTNCVDLLEQPDTLLQALRQNALNHTKRHIAKAAYDDLRQTILKLLGTQLNEKFTPATNEAWDKVLKVVFKTITDINNEQ